MPPFVHLPVVVPNLAVPLRLYRAPGHPHQTPCPQQEPRTRDPHATSPWRLYAPPCFEVPLLRRTPSCAWTIVPSTKTYSKSGIRLTKCLSRPLFKAPKLENAVPLPKPRRKIHPVRTRHKTPFFQYPIRGAIRAHIASRHGEIRFEKIVVLGSEHGIPFLSEA